MDLIANVLLVVGAFAAAVYCIVLARRLKRFNNLQNGVGGAVAVLSAQVDDMTKTLQKAQKAAAYSSASLTQLTDRAEDVARRLEIMMASMHDLPGEAAAPSDPRRSTPEAGLELDLGGEDDLPVLEPIETEEELDLEFAEAIDDGPRFSSSRSRRMEVAQ